MTAQFSDAVFYRNRPFSLAGVNGQGLFVPEAHGLEPQSSCSACWRGYLVGYEVADDRLRLRDLSLFAPAEEMAAARKGEGKPLFGVRPYVPEKSSIVRYDDLHHPLDFTGGLLLGDDFIDELYVHMGFHPAWKYHEVHELIFDAGRLTKAADRSAEMASLREGIDAKGLQPSLADGGEGVEEWIRKSFTLDYRW
jgi:hypothetical protein